MNGQKRLSSIFLKIQGEGLQNIKIITLGVTFFEAGVVEILVIDVN